jgi:hypothetical protein
MAVVDLHSELQASAPAVWSAVKTPAAFRRVTRGLLAMPAIQHRESTWEVGETVVGWVFLFGFIPFSRHTLHISVIDDAARTLSSRESGGLVRIWNHDIIVTPVGDRRCVYRDRVEIDAGMLTPFVALYATWFYRARQRRWRTLAKELNS